MNRKHNGYGKFDQLYIKIIVLVAKSLTCEKMAWWSSPNPSLGDSVKNHRVSSMVPHHGNLIDCYKPEFYIKPTFFHGPSAISN